MANNNPIYNAVIAGVTAGGQQRWITAKQSSSYTDYVARVLIIASLIDSLIPASATIGTAQARLMQSICECVYADRDPMASANINAIANSIVVLYNAQTANLLPEADGGFGPSTFVFNVGKSPNFYPTIQAAMDAINVLIAAGTIGAGQRATIQIYPGQYVMTATVDVPSFVSIQGISDKSTVQLINATTDMFRVIGANTWFSNFIIEGSNNPNIWAFNYNNQNGGHVRNVDMLNNGGQCTQKFLKQVGIRCS